MKVIPFFIWLIGSTFATVAQDRPLRFINFNTKHGLPTSFITDMCQDRAGFIWVGTDNGLSRFDGAKFTNFFFDPKNKNSLSGNRIYKVTEDKAGNIWIASNHGIDKFIKQTQSFRRYNYTPDDSGSIPDNEVYDVFSDSKGRLWIGTLQGMGLYNPAKDNFIRYYLPPDSNNFEFANSVSSIREDKQGNIWISPQTEGIYKFIPEKGTFVHTPVEGTNFRHSINPNSKLLFIDNENTIWLGTGGNGLFKYQPSVQTVKWYRSLPFKKGLNNNIIFDFVDMPDNELWLATDGGGINILNKKTDEFRYIKADLTINNGLKSNATEVFLKDCQNNLWIGTVTAGLFVYNEYLNFLEQYRWTPETQSHLSNNKVIDIIEDQNGLLWIGTDGGGLNCFDPQTGKFSLYTHKESDPASLSGNVICAILEDGPRYLWIGNFATGLNHFDRKTGRAIHYMPDAKDPNSLLNPSIWSMLKDNTGKIWIATLGGGLSCFNPHTHTFKNYLSRKDDPKSLISNIINSLAKDLYGNIWCSTNKGLSVLDVKSGTFQQLKLIKPGTATDFSELHCVITDKEGMIWAGTSWGGVFKINPATKQYTFFDLSNNQLNNAILTMVEDDINQLWIGTSNGLGCLSKQTGAVKFYGEADGLPASGFTQTSGTKLRSGKIALGSNEGFVIFDPKTLKSYPYPPILLISDFQIRNKSILPGDTVNGRRLLQNPIYETAEIKLSYKEHEWSLGFSLLQFVNQGKAKVFYKLEGYDKDWRKADLVSRNIKYTFLPAGTYHFMIKAENGDGVWCKPKILKIIINPPFWKTIWFYILSAFLLTGIIIFIIYLRTYQLNNRKKALEAIVQQRTKELANVNTLLEERQEEIVHQNEELFVLNQALAEQKDEILKQNEELVNHRKLLESRVEERTRELQVALQKAVESEKLKSAFLANMSHEIRTPMNAILGFSDLLDENTHPQKTREFIDIIKKSGQTLMVLIDDIIDFSKIEAGVLEFQSSEFDFCSLISDLHTHFAIDNQNPKVELKLEKNCTTKQVLLSDRIRTGQILSNFITNALKFTHEGAVTLGCETDSSGNIISYVKDTGIGIPADKFEYIFEAFNKIEDNTDRFYRGAGLGLAISNYLAKQMDYKLRVESVVGVGSTFFMEIPAYKKVGSQVKEPSEPKQTTSNDFTGKTILVAEDETANFLFLKEILLPTQCEVIWAKDGKECHDIALENPKIDLVLMDIKMPVVNGLEANKMLRESGFSKPIVALTAYASPSDKQRFGENEFDAYLTKPIRPDILLGELTRWLSSR